MFRYLAVLLERLNFVPARWREDSAQSPGLRRMNSSVAGVIASRAYPSVWSDMVCGCINAILPKVSVFVSFEVLPLSPLAFNGCCVRYPDLDSRHLMPPACGDMPRGQTTGSFGNVLMSTTSTEGSFCPEGQQPASVLMPGTSSLHQALGDRWLLMVASSEF